ncbi:MAG: ATP-binding protein [Candidatus Micrarchaeota archaeon]|nr:ATP-binding protein [Candidatus Micrarchaeota archaeon]
MKTDEVKEYLSDFQEKEIPRVIYRTLTLPDSAKIISVIGPRRAGKTYLLYQKMRELMSRGVKKENIVYLNFEEFRLVGLTFREIRDVLKIQWQLYPGSKEGKLYIFIDEPQNIENWETSVRGLQDEGFHIFLTGSSSKLLSKEIATSLRGRTLSYLLLPFSFEEFLGSKNAKVSANPLSSREKASLLQFIDEYLRFGGYPEVALEQNPDIKLNILKEYFNTVVYRDIIERNNVRNSRLIKWLIKSIVSSFSKEYSIHKIYLSLKSQGLKVSKNTLYSYLSLLEDSNFAIPLQKFKQSVRKMELGFSKIYLCDVGFVEVVGLADDRGKRLENVIFLELLRKARPLTEIYYWKNVQQEEVDFVLRDMDKITELIQACYDPKNSETKEREVRALLKAGKELKCENLTVITYDYEGEEEYEWFGIKGRIRYIPLWKWILKMA